MKGILRFRIGPMRTSGPVAGERLLACVYLPMRRTSRMSGKPHTTTRPIARVRLLSRVSQLMDL